MESEWELDRMRLFYLRRAHPDWTLPRLAQELRHSLSWVKKWLRRFREAGQPTLAMFKSRSRAPHHRPHQVVVAVRDAILSLRDGLKDVYGRVVGPKTILYHLHRDRLLHAQHLYLPRSTRTIWQVLKEGGRIPTRVREQHPIERPEPMQHWEMDFGQLGDAFEFLSVVDRGTSILVDTQTQPHYNAESALWAIARLLVASGLPQRLRFDNDTRFVGNWLTDGYPSPLMRFLLCLGVEPDLVEPGKPYHKPFAERSIRTLKHECLWLDPPQDWLDAAGILEVYRDFYNHERANQSLACGNRPPYEAFPSLPCLSRVPDTGDPDAWLPHYHHRMFGRRVGRNGMIGVGRHDYYVGYAHAGDPAYSLKTLQGQYNIAPQLGQVIPFKASFANKGESGGWGVALAAPVAFTNTSNGSSVDNGAQSTNGGAANLHVLTAAAADTYTIVVEGSTTGAFAGEQTTLATFTLNASALGSERVAITGTIPRYTRWKATRTGAAGDTVKIAVSLIRV